MNYEQLLYVNEDSSVWSVAFTLSADILKLSDNREIANIQL